MDPHGQLWAAAWAVTVSALYYGPKNHNKKTGVLVFVFSFLNPAAEIVLNMLFITLLTPHNRQKRRTRKERTK